jgi:hypothetical protein
MYFPPAAPSGFPANCGGSLACLSQSPMFAMSLGAKELFHTNFLAFLLECQDPLVVPVQQKLKGLLFGRNNIGRVIAWREKGSLDLVIMPAPIVVNDKINLDRNCKNETCNHPNKVCRQPNSYCDVIAVVIEAKLKSIPTQCQLDEYDKKLMAGIEFDLDDADTLQVQNGKVTKLKLLLHTNGGMNACVTNCTIEARDTGKAVSSFTGMARRLLLRPMSHNQGGCNSLPLPSKMNCWEEMNWQCIVDALNCNNTACIAPPHPPILVNCKATSLLPSVICDYRDSLEQLLLILNNTNQYVGNALRNNTVYQDYCKAIIDPSFRILRIHDLVGKYASHILERQIFDFLCRSINPVNWGGSCTNIFTLGDNEANERHSVSQCTFRTQPPSISVCGLNFELSSYTYFSHQQPCIGFQWHSSCKCGKERKEREISFGVEIQDSHYRHFIAVDGSDASLGLQHKALDELSKIFGNGPGGWFLDTNPFLTQSRAFHGKQMSQHGSIADFYVFDINKFRFSKSSIFPIGGSPKPLLLIDLPMAICHSLCQAASMASKSSGSCQEIKAFLGSW